MKILQSPLFYTAVINFILIAIAAAKMTKAPDGAAILSLFILMAGAVITLAIFLVDFGIRALPLGFNVKIGMQVITILTLVFFEHHLLIEFLSYKP